MTPQEQAAFDAMREALERIAEAELSPVGSPLVMIRQIQQAASAALTAAKEVTAHGVEPLPDEWPPEFCKWYQDLPNFKPEQLYPLWAQAAQPLSDAELLNEARLLWLLLDDIDTADDIAKSDDKLYRSICQKVQKMRWAIWDEKRIDAANKAAKEQQA